MDVTIENSGIFPTENKFYITYFNPIEKCLAFVYSDNLDIVTDGIF